ncbi:acetyl-CoA acetyltransferase [bacterium]|mgnify:FL=1|jgi:acetyl-CoA C-acetyltransferase|nr:acetyl-CoA acetyltransferase [bacterium]GIR62168.1 MAG: acetyl-CoA acetyltransferase [Alphaproteobacteria bacterium]|tara:strand:- start:433 stop:1596 length:1164 start_codon:yes stop_codon:yes gene_type:complete
MGNIIGWGHNKFGRNDTQSTEDMIAEVVSEAISHAQVDPKDIDNIVVGTFNNGFQKQDFHGALPAINCEVLKHVPSLRVENACATGSAAIHTALNSIEAKRSKLNLVVGVEKMTDRSTKEAGDILLGASYRKEEDKIDGGFAGVFAQITDTYFQRYGDQTKYLSKIAAKNHKNGAVNPYAHMQVDLGFDFCNKVSEKNPLVAPPLKRSDCSMISDGAAALIIADDELALEAEKAISFKARVQMNDLMPMSKRDKTEFRGASLSWKKALSDAQVNLMDLSFVETHDCFTIAELIEYEAMGLTQRGEGYKVLEEGTVYKDGKLPINPSGGLKAKGHPVGATGVSQHVMACMQLVGEAKDMQIKDASLGGIFNMGGSAVANYVSILERKS